MVCPVGVGMRRSLQGVAAVVGGVLNVHVFVRVLVFGCREAEAFRLAVVLVAVQLREQEVNARVNQAQVGQVAETLERGSVSPQGE